MNETIDGINQSVFRLWGRHFADDADTLCPIIYSSFTISSLLFVGLNPSYTREWERKLRDVAPSGIDPSSFFHWRNRRQFDFALARHFERYSRENYKRFFGKLAQLAAEVDMPWEHIDLFFLRKTKQNDLKQIVGLEGNNFSPNEFGRDQLKLSTLLIEIAKPKIIVVANAMASKILAHRFKPRFNSEYGYHLLKLCGRDVPIFFSSMLTGGRALDVFSYERLKWHILQAKDRSS